MIDHSGRPRIARMLQKHSRDRELADLDPPTQRAVRLTGTAVMLAVALLGVLAMAGCPKPPSTALYPVPMPVLEPVEPLEYERAPDTCDGPEPFLTGEPVPFADDDGVATCGGILVGDDEFARYVHLERVTEPWLRTYATECAAGRERDRVWAQAAYDHQVAAATALQRENRALRLAEPMLFVGGILVGCGLVAAVYAVP